MRRSMFCLFGLFVSSCASVAHAGVMFDNRTTSDLFLEAYAEDHDEDAQEFAFEFRPAAGGVVGAVEIVMGGANLPTDPPTFWNPAYPVRAPTLTVSTHLYAAGTVPTSRVWNATSTYAAPTVSTDSRHGVTSSFVTFADPTNTPYVPAGENRFIGVTMGAVDPGLFPDAEDGARETNFLGYAGPRIGAAPTVGTAGDGVFVKFASESGWNLFREFPSLSARVLTLLPGDVNDDFQINAKDILQITSRNRYGKGGTTASWQDGDFSTSTAPGDGKVDARDVLAIAATNAYGKGSYKEQPAAAAKTLALVAAQSTTLQITYDPSTGALATRGGLQLTGLIVDSASMSFNGKAKFPAGTSFNANDPGEIATFAFGASFGDYDIGSVLPAGLSAAFVLGDLTATYTLNDQVGTFAATIVIVPEPADVGLWAGIAGCSLAFVVRRRV